MHRRQFLARAGLTGLGLAAAGAGLAGCANPANQTSPTTTAPGGPGVFPATVTHRYGSTTISATPQRIVTVGQTDHDPVLALGLVPVAVAGFESSDYSPVRPWNADLIAADVPVLNMLELPFEKIAALTPDLILGVMSGMTKSDYAKLAAIAPTVAQHPDYADWTIPYRPHTELVGAALGRTAAAEQLLSALDERFAATRTDNPSLVGRTAFCAELWESDFDVIGPSAPRTQFLTDVGMVLPDPLVALVGKDYNTKLSNEKVDLLGDLDVVVWTTDATAVDTLLANKLVAGLRTTQQGRYVLAPNGGDNDDLLYSMDWGTVLSNGWAIENAVPRLVKAVDGDVSTDPNV